MQHLDPHFQRLRDIVRLRGGTVSHLRADGFTAVFGAPLAQEDDAVRACQAALEMCVQPSAHGAAALRVGLHAGEVVIRPSKDNPSAGFQAIGPMMSLAEQLAASALPGSILISEAAKRRADGFIRTRRDNSTQPQEPLVVRFTLEGLAEARSRWEMRAATGLTEFVGRQAEIEHLRRAASLAAIKRGQIVGIVGEAGIGKSRLVHEFLRGELTSWTVMRTGAVAGGARGAYAPVIQLLRSWIGAGSQDTLEQLAGKASMALDPLPAPTPTHKMALLSLLDLPVAEDGGSPT